MKITSKAKLTIYEEKVKKHKEHNTIQNVEYSKSKERKTMFDKLNGENFFSTKEVSLLDFVERRIFNDLFSNASLDMDAIDISIKESNKKINSLKEEIKTKYDDAVLDLNVLSSLVDWVSIYNSSSNGLFFIKEGFNSNKDIIANNNLLVDTFEGKVTLFPSDATSVPINTDNIVVNDGSNGDFSEELGASNMVDGSDNSYAEYSQSLASEGLCLDFTLELRSSYVINQIVIKPNDFCSQNWLSIEDIQTSLDGISFSSINDRKAFYRKGFSEHTNENVKYILDPASQNHTNRFTIDFQPIKAKYIRLIVNQDRLHPELDKYMIGISEIYVNRANYNARGSLVLKKPLNTKTLRSLSLSTKGDTKVDSKLLGIEYAISFDNRKWYDIQPLKSLGEKKEILNFNQEWIEDNIKIEEHDSVYLKINMQKNLTAEDIQNIISDYSLYSSQITPFPASSPFSIRLDSEPIDGSLRLVSFPYITAGGSLNNKMKIGKTSPSSNSYKIELPFNPLGSEDVYIGKYKIEKYNDIEDIGVLIDGNALGYFIFDNMLYLHIPKNTGELSNDIHEPWLEDLWEESTMEEVVASEGNNTATAPEVKEIENSIQTSYKDNKNIPTAVSIYDEMRLHKDIYLYMKADKSQGTPSIKLKHLSDGIKNNISVEAVQYDKNGTIEQQTVEDFIAKGTTRIKLTRTPFDLEVFTVTASGGRVDYIDGFHEFINSSEFAFSVDIDNRTLYLRDAYSADIHCSYLAENRMTLNPKDYKISEDGKIVTIKKNAFNPAATYLVKYNVAIEIPKDFYSLSKGRKEVILNAEAIINSIYTKSVFKEKKIKASYRYRENLKEVLKEIGGAMTPVLDEIVIICAADGI